MTADPNDIASVVERLRSTWGISDPDNMIAHGAELDWLIRQLVAWPTRIHPERTTNDRFLRESAALTLAASHAKVAELEAEREALLHNFADATDALVRTRRKLDEATATPAPAKELDDLIDECWQESLDVDNRASPEEYPDFALISHAELADYMRRAAGATPAPDRDAVLEEAAWVVESMRFPNGDDRNLVAAAIRALASKENQS